MERRFEPSNFDRNNRSKRNNPTNPPDEPFNAEEQKIILTAMECMFTRQQDRGLKLLESLTLETQEHLFVVTMRLGSR